MVCPVSLAKTFPLSKLVKIAVLSELPESTKPTPGEELFAATQVTVVLLSALWGEKVLLAGPEPIEAAASLEIAALKSIKNITVNNF